MENLSLKKLVSLPENPSECWDWMGNINKKTGYGKKTVLGKSMLAHRWIYQMLFGRIPENMVINHLCKNRKCINPHHLEVVSQSVNCQHGDASKLTLDQVREIKERLKTVKWGERKKIADEYGVSPSLISDIKYGRAWK